MEMKSLLVWSAVTASVAVFATPSVSVTGIATNSVGDVVVSYTLSDEDAIVTCETFVDGVSVGRVFSGDANRRVAQGARSFVWSPRNEGVAAGGEVSAKVTAWTFDNPPDYLAIELNFPNVRRYYATAEMLPFPITNDIYKTGMMLMRKIPAKDVVWRMGQDNDKCNINGSNFSESNVRDMETPHMVKLTKDFYIGVYLVTHYQYATLTGLTPSYYKTVYGGGNDALLPVEQVSYDALRGEESATFLNWPLAGHEVAPGSVLATGVHGRIVARSTDGGTVGVRLPRRYVNGAQQRTRTPIGQRERPQFRRGRMDKVQFRLRSESNRTHNDCWNACPQQLGTLRHARQRVREMPRPVRERR